MANEVADKQEPLQQQQQEVEAAAPSGSLLSNLVSFFVPTAHAEEGDDEEEKDEEEGGAEEEEEEEPEDQCEETQCTGPSKHFKHCAEKVDEGRGWHGEDCVEEMFHLMHCVDACAAPRVFKKLN